MLTIWLLLAVSVGLFVISTYKLFLLHCLYKGPLVEAIVDHVTINSYPMRLTSGRPEYELIVSYSYVIDAVKYTGIDNLRTNDINRFNQAKTDINKNNKITIKTSTYNPEVSSLFFDKKNVIAAIILIVTSGFLAFSTLFYI